jgi:hypothetical protein
VVVGDAPAVDVVGDDGVDVLVVVVAQPAAATTATAKTDMLVIALRRCIRFLPDRRLQNLRNDSARHNRPCESHGCKDHTPAVR